MDNNNNSNPYDVTPLQGVNTQQSDNLQNIDKIDLIFLDKNSYNLKHG